MFRRCFIAINFDEQTKNVITGEIQKISKRMPFQKFIDVKKIHLTLRFLGQVSDRQINQSIEFLQNISGQFPPFSLQLDTYLAFPDFTHPQIIGLKVKVNQDLLKLADSLNQTFNDSGIGKKETRIFKPHLTIARLNNGVGDLSFLQNEYLYIEAAIASVDLMESRLSPQGSTYQPIKKFKLSRT